MAFCTNCGKEITSGVKFCGNCGQEQIPDSLKCTKCGTELEEGAKFCSTCGNSVEVNKAPSETKTEEKKVNKTTKSGEKIIDSGPKVIPPAPRKVKQAAPVRQKKKRGCMARLFRIVGILFLLVIAFFVVVYFLPDSETKEDTLTDTNIPGIVDIEEGDVSHLPENRNKKPEQINTEPIKEAADIKQAAKSVEDAFANADTTQLKNLLTESALLTYSGVYKEMIPHMEDLGKAFKNRKLITATDIYQIYEFVDDKGEKYTAAFELQPNGDWKLTRF